MNRWLRGRGGRIEFGGDYNPEQWPRSVWREDVALMREAGVTLVTVGVFSWARPSARSGRVDAGLARRRPGTVLHGTPTDDGARLGPREVAVVERPG